MKNKRFLYWVSLALISIIAISAICIVVFFLPADIPETEDITKFESVDINLSDQSHSLYYSFVPNGSGILYVDTIFRADANREVSKEYLYYHLDFKSRETRVIHEIDFPDNDSRSPVIYWQDAGMAFLGAESYGECSPEFLSDGVKFNVDTNEKTSASCTGGIGLTNPEIETRDYPDKYTRDGLGKQHVEIHSLDGQYYFLWKLESNCYFLTCYFGEASSKNYIEVYSAKDKMIRRIYLGETGQMTTGPLYIGCVGFWSNTNQIVVIPESGSKFTTNSHYKVYFIDPEK